MGVSWGTGLNGQMARECNKWPELGRPCCWEGKTEGAEKLSWEPKRTESKLCTAELARRGDLVMAVTPLWQRRGATPFAPCWMVRAVDVRVVSKACFAGVKKPAGAKGHPSFQEWLYWQDWWLPEEAWGSVSDKAEQVEDPKAAEVVARDLVWKL